MGDDRSQFEQVLNYTEGVPTRSVSKEQLRYDQGNSFVSLLKLSVGPLIYQVGIALHDAADLFLINKALGASSLQVVGFSTMMRYLGMSIAIFFGSALSGRLARLIGENRPREAEQVFVDVIRLAVPAELIAGIIFYFVTIPMLKFMGCTQDLAEQGREYLTPILFSLPFIAVFQLCVAFLQSEGRSILCGCMQFCAFILNCCAFGPLLLFGLNVSLKYAGLSFVFAQIIPGIILFFLIFAGKFGLRPEYQSFKKRFSPETLSALAVGLPFILNVLMGTIPPLLMMNLMMRAAAVEGIAHIVGAVFSVFLKIQTMVNSFSIGFGQGFFVAGSNARGTKNHPRLRELFLWALLLTFTLQLLILPLLVAKPELIGGIWIEDPDQLAYSHDFLRIPFYTNMLVAINEVVMNLLMAMQYPVTAMTPSILRGVSFIVSSFTLHHFFPSKSINIMYTYCINDLSIFVLDLIIVIFPMRRLLKDERESSTVLLKGATTVV